MSERRTTWVVYERRGRGGEEATNAVCEQAEWDAMEQAQPGRNVLVRSGITNEGEAERLARGTSGDPVPRAARTAAPAAPAAATAPT